MIGSRINHRKQTAGAQDAGGLGKILGRQHTDYKVCHSISDRPLAPYIGNGKCQARPAARSLASCLCGDIEAETNHRSVQYGSDLPEVVAGATANIEHSPTIVRCCRCNAPRVVRNRLANGVEMSSIEKCRPVPQLDCAVASASRQTSSSSEQIDVARPRDIEAMAIRAGERAP